MQYASTGDVTVQQVRSRPTELFAFHFFNRAGTARYVKFYDAAKPSDVTVGTTPVVMEVPVTTLAAASMSKLRFKFLLGLQVAVTTGNGDSDTGAGSARDIIGFIHAGQPGAER